MMSLSLGLAEPSDPHTPLMVTLGRVTFCPFIYGQCVKQKKEGMRITLLLKFFSIILTHHHPWFTYLSAHETLFCAHAASWSPLVLPFCRPVKLTQES